VTSRDVTLLFSDHETRTIRCSEEETIVQAANRFGLKLLVDCREGACGTCKASCRIGDFVLDDFSADALPPSERACGFVLACRMSPRSDCLIEFDYPLAQARRGKAPAPRSVTITRLERIAADVLELRVAAEDGKRFEFLPGQYANLDVPSRDVCRSYSFAMAPGETEAVFAIRLVPGGEMSGWLSERARTGDKMLVAGPYGRFFLRRPDRKLLMIAGGTGIGPMLSMLETLSHFSTPPGSVTVVFGVTIGENIFYQERLAACLADFAHARAIMVAMHAGEAWNGLRGTAVDALSGVEISPATDAYLCGPPAMIEAARARLHEAGMNDGAIFAEAFLPTHRTQTG
jgi:ferredoxin-NADP reductase/ferredoxin